MSALPMQNRPPSALAATLSHARYVIAGDPVTAFAFGLLALLIIAAVFGPALVPYDPLASDTSATLQAPSLRHWFGTDQLGRDIFSRVVVATRLKLARKGGTETCCHLNVPASASSSKAASMVLRPAGLPCRSACMA